MNARFSKIVLSLVLIVVFALGIAPFAGAQEGPPQVGLRPDAPPYALHGPYWVGTMEFEAETDLHPALVALWYPAVNPDALEETVSYSFEYWGPRGLAIAGHALRDAAPDITGGPYPLVIYAHGWQGGPYVSAYLCEHLASQGFVVMAIEYADNYGTENTVPFESTWYTRPRDVTWQIDYAETLTATGGAMEGMIDTEQVAVTGWSLGGYTALAAGGGQLDLSTLKGICSAYPAYAWMCSYIDAKGLARLAGLDALPEGVWPSWGDSRVDAIVPFAPWVLGLGQNRLNDVAVPALVLFGSIDSAVIPEFEFYKSFVYDSLGSVVKSLIVFENGTHFLLHNACRDWPWRVERYPWYECNEPVWDMDRAHDLINHFTTAFLLATLKDDAEAAAALSPDAVAFPGITYEATGF